VSSAQLLIGMGVICNLPLKYIVVGYFVNLFISGSSSLSLVVQF